MATTVTVGGAAATAITVVSATEITATVPAGTVGAADVVVTTSAGSDTLAGAFTYTATPVPPDVTAVDPDTGDEAGGTVVTITGTGFEA